MSLVLLLLGQVIPLFKDSLSPPKLKEAGVESDLWRRDIQRDQILGDAPEEVRLRNVPANMFKTAICLWGRTLCQCSRFPMS